MKTLRKDWEEYRKGAVGIGVLALIFTALLGESPVLDMGLLDPVPVALMIVALIAIYIAFAPLLLLQSYGRVMIVFPPFLLIGAGAVWFLWGHVPDEHVSRIYPGLVTGLIVVLGWFVTFVISSYREAERTDRIRRDTLVAIKNEIFALVDKLDNVSIRKSATEVQANIKSGVLDHDGKMVLGEDGKQVEYYPFATMESEPIVFEALAASVPGLSEATVASVVRFYAEYTDLRRMVEDSRTKEVRDLSRGRRVAFHKQLTKRRIWALTSGLTALVEINRELGIEDPENIRRSGMNPNITP